MTTAPPITPHAALGWLQSLSVDIEAAAVLDASGAVLAGDPELADAQPEKRLIVVRSGQYALAVRHGPRALLGLLEADAQAAVAALEPA